MLLSVNKKSLAMTQDRLNSINLKHNTEFRNPQSHNLAEICQIYRGMGCSKQTIIKNTRQSKYEQILYVAKMYWIKVLLVKRYALLGKILQCNRIKLSNKIRKPMLGEKYFISFIFVKIAAVRKLQRVN